MSESKEPNAVEVPEECPQIETCQEAMTKDEFESFCQTGTWIHCDKILAENTKKYKKTPKEWRERLVKSVRQ